MDKQPVGQLPNLTQSNNDDEIMVITNSEYNQLKKEKISDFITDLTSTDENNAIVKGTDGKLFTKDFGNASNITEGTLPISVLPDIPKDKLPEIETDDLPDSGITAGTYTYPTDIVVNSKGQVTSITEGQPGTNNANQDLSNLGPLGLDKINQSKALETGSVSSDADVYADVQKYAHSTFDLAKFEVVGSPNITEDGVLSNCSSNNIVQTPIINITKPNWEFNFVIDTNGISGSAGVLGIPSIGFCYVNNNVDTGICNIYLVQEWTGGGGVSFGSLPLNKKYQVVWGMNGTTHYSKLKEFGAAEWLKENTTTYETVKTTSSAISIGRDTTNNTYLTSGSIDLKYFSITVDGVEVFNGNKTGIDVIKPDDYEVVGSPVISEDGVASGFSAGVNYVQVSPRIASISQNYATWEIIEKFTTSTVSGDQYLMVGTTYWTNLILLRGNKLCWCLRSTESNNYDLANYQVGTHTFSENTTYYIKFKYDGAKYSLEYSTDGINFTEDLSITSSLKLNDTASGTILGTYFTSTNADFKGTIDLNTYKFYIEDELVWQPCLKIPYTLSKTGSKIVDAAYRDRVKDVYEQYGTAMYYTIDEENQNFTLPMGEIYGMIAQNKTFDGFSLFDTKLTDRILTGDEALGWALQGSLVTMTYPDAVNRIKEEYAQGTVGYIKHNLPLPEFTSNTTNGITVSDSGGHDDAYSLINGYTTGPWSSYWFNIDYDEQTYIKTYSLKADNSGEAEYPSAWTLQANNGGDTDWVTLDTQTAQTFKKNQQKTYPVNSETSYRQYRIVFSDGKETSGGNGELSQISFDVDNILFEYKTAVNGHLIADISQKTAIDTLYSETGIADFYILDSTNNQFYLPRNKYFMQLTDSTALLNSYNEPGLPNIKTEYENGMCRVATNNYGELLPPLVSVGTSNSAGSGGVPLHMVNLDVSTINSVYGNSETVQPPSSNKLLYYKVGHTVTNSGSIDVANVLSDINLLEANKADKDLSNCTKPYVTETYVNGTSWYRLWSDGWCEQGNTYWKNSAVDALTTISFIKPFSNTNYSFSLNCLHTTEPIGYGGIAEVYPSRTMSQTVIRQSSNLFGYAWRACGY